MDSIWKELTLINDSSRVDEPQHTKTFDNLWFPWCCQPCRLYAKNVT